PTIQYAIDQNAKVILASHLGRPKGKNEKEFSLEPIAQRLLFHLKKEVLFSEDCVAHGNRKIIQDMKEGDVFLLENLRFHPGEEANSEHFATQLSKYCDVYIDDAFGAVHRAHASVDALPKIVKEKGGGFLLKKETEALSGLLRSPKRPFTVVLGGSKVSDKMELIKNLLPKVDTMLIGGAMAYTFLKAQGRKVGKSLVEENKEVLAKNLLEEAQQHQVEFLLPRDHVIAQELSESAFSQITSDSTIPDGWMGLDIGPKTVELFTKAIQKSETVLWNGPVGAFEVNPFSVGTLKIAQAISQNRGCTVVGGGDSVSAIHQFKLQFKFFHVSTGGGASLEFLEGKTLPGIAALEL
ncbi:MAG: phosphoglycerate kinase, partial [Deltaproteobacteria bacterium]|nr:phosphoglycerate kinase [Deltaproteobacteria bacterium]